MTHIHLPCDQCGRNDRPTYASGLCRHCWYHSPTFARLTPRQRGAVERCVAKTHGRLLTKRARRIAYHAGVAV